MNGLDDKDQDLRGLLARQIAAKGYAPTVAELAEMTGQTVPATEAALHRLHNAHVLQLHPHACVPWVVHPFALAAGACWVETPAKGYWANCLYCGLGIAAALCCDATIITRLGGEECTAVYRIRNRELLDTDGVFHLATPIAHWWDNVVYACTTFQPFADAKDVGDWCERHAIPHGVVMSMPALWRFASDWYGGHLHENWRKRSSGEVRALLDAHGLTGPFWTFEEG